jgi:hypothetical protein
MLYYYKDEQNQDAVVKVSAMLEMFNELGTPVSLKTKKALAQYRQSCNRISDKIS